MRHWSKSFGKISANEFFNAVDYNHDGCIQYEEFVDFWKIVKGAGHGEDEIEEQVRNFFLCLFCAADQNQKWRDMGRFR